MSIDHINLFGGKLIVIDKLHGFSHNSSWRAACVSFHIGSFERIFSIRNMTV